MKILTKTGFLAMAAVTASTAGCGSTAATSAGTPVGCSTAGAAATAASADYRYVLDVGPTEEMYSKAEVAGRHPKTGEVMLNGAMTMAPGPNAQHLEVHICAKGNGHAVTGAPPTITVSDTTANTTAPIRVATMQGVTSGPADVHYGNNVDAPPGHSFVVQVAFRAQQAALHFTRAH
ncbi:MAG: hypothetical protein M3Y91_09430 [Actinomycetota bacterium]|nr:hypothetical protein [Actinomycetota bacterium]